MGKFFAYVIASLALAIVVGGLAYAAISIWKAVLGL